MVKSIFFNNFYKIRMSLNQCQICLENINEKYFTKCNHIFCKSCITKWLLKNNSCPTCRHILYNDNDNDNDNDSFDYELTYYTQYISHYEFINIKAQYRDYIYDQCDNLIEDVLNNNLNDIHFNPIKNSYESDDFIENNLYTVFFTFIWTPHNDKCKVTLDIVYNLNYLFIKNKCNYINHRGLLLNLNYTFRNLYLIQ